MVGMLLLILLVGFPSPGRAADIYRCRNAAGNWMFSDDPTLFPSDCKPVEKGTPKGTGGGLIIVPSAPVPSSTEADQLLQEQEKSRAQKAKKVRSLKEEATRLASEFQKVQAERIPSMPPATITKALADMLRIEQRSAELRRQTESEPLSSEDQKAIRDILAPIPPPP